MNISGKVIQVAIDVDVKKKDGGTYKGWKLVYEQSDGEVKTIQKHMNSLKYAAPLANGLKELKAGDTFTMEMEKEGDFWNPKSIFKGEASPTVDKVPFERSGVIKPTTTTTSNSTYATKEERAQTQKYIVRQSSITAALKLFELRKEKVSVEEIIDIAGCFEAWVLGNSQLATKEVSDSLEDLDDDIPF